MHILISGCLSLILQACTPAPMKQLAASGFEHLLLESSPYPIAALSRSSDAPKMCQVYFEGDGRAWLNRYQVSPDPTPSNPLALHLMQQDSAPCLLYLARPCQFQGRQAASCQPKVWTQSRFSAQVIKANNHAIDLWLKRFSHPPKLNFIGFSGGGGLAALIASTRQDVLSLRTVAADLDIEIMQTYHHSTPLLDSINPRDRAAQLSQLPQIHFIGGLDKVVPKAVALNFVKQMGQENCAEVTECAEMSHQRGWREAWPELLEHKFNCKAL